MVPHRVHRWATKSQPIYLSADHVQHPNTLAPPGIQMGETHPCSVSRSMVNPDQTHCQEISCTHVLQGTGQHLHQKLLCTERGARDRDSRVDFEKYTQE